MVMPTKKEQADMAARGKRDELNHRNRAVERRNALIKRTETEQFSTDDWYDIEERIADLTDYIDRIDGYLDDLINA